MKGFVTIQEAVRLTGTSDSTIRRWLRQLNSQEQKHVRRSGQRLFIEQSFLERAFRIEEGEADLAEYIPQRQDVSADLQQLLQRQQDNIDRLLEENSRKDADLKDAWSMISRLKEEALQLAFQVKALQAGRTEEKPDQLQRFAVIALLVIIGALVVWLVFLSR